MCTYYISVRRLLSFSAMLQKSAYYAPIMLTIVPSCPEYASTILKLNALLEYLLS